MTDFYSVKKKGNMVEASSEHKYALLPADNKGYKIFRKLGGNAKYAHLFGVKLKVAIKK